MSQSLLFLPDISGFTKFVQTTEISHSQHVIAELLEVLVAATEEMQLAEIEGDALFFYKEEIPSLEKLLAQIETLFTAFYSHLKLLEKNRICPCNACSSAPKLQLKIIAHSGAIEFITVQGNRKPFGQKVIEAHRLLKNSVASDNYILISKDLSEAIQLLPSYKSKLFNFENGEDNYDSKKIPYLFSLVNLQHLKLTSYALGNMLHFEKVPDIQQNKSFSVNATQLLEFITNYSYRHYWVEGVNKFEYDANEVTRIGTEHQCIINAKHLNFIAVTKKGKPGQLVYGEFTDSIPQADEIYQFYIVTPIDSSSCKLDVEIFLKTKSIFNKIIIFLFLKKLFRKNVEKTISKLKEVLEESTIEI